MLRDADRKKPLSQEWKQGFLAAHEGFKDIKERGNEDVEMYGLAEIHRWLETKQGYVRAGYGHDGLFWVRAKWTQGPLEGRYVFGSGASLGLAMAQVCTQIAKVECGKLKALPDTGYRTIAKSR